MYRNDTTTKLTFFATAILVIISAVSGNLLQNAPHRPEFQGYQSADKEPRLSGKLEYQLSETDASRDSSSGVLLSFISSLFRSELIGNFIKSFDTSIPVNQPSLHDAVFHSSNNDRRQSLAQNNDEKTKFEASLSRDVPSGNGKNIRDQEWANTLFGPTGVLTTIFHLMDDRRRDSLPRRKLISVNNERLKLDSEVKQQNSYSNITHLQSDILSLPQIFKNAKPMDFAKIFKAFLASPQGDFEDPIAELPEFLGICNRLSCGDIYKAIDQFRRSEFFTNFQTALQLIQDPKGWEIMGDLLSNPELISEFTSSSGLDKLFGSTLTGQKQNNKRPGTEIGPEDGNLGTDFTPLITERVTEKEKKPKESEMPEFAENVDDIDYYNAVENGEDEDVINSALETATKAEETILISNGKKKSGPDNEDILLPEISESIDESIETVTKMTIEFKTTHKFPSNITTKNAKARLITASRILSTTKMPTVNRIIQKPNTDSLVIVNVQPQTTSGPSTTRNFRRSNDYYAMYYDD